MSMAVMRIHKNGNYTIMANHHFKEREMSLKAKGLLSLMLSLPDDWDYSVMGLVTLSKDGKDSVMGALQELERFGYLKRTRMTDERGRFAGYDYDIYEEPRSASPNEDNPYSGNPHADNPPQSNTDQSNTDQSNTNEPKDKMDKMDKGDSPFSDDLSTKLSTKPNSFSKKLIDAEYIEEDDLFMNVYNQLFIDSVAKYGFEMVRSCLWYFIKRLRDGNAYDEDGRIVENKFGYLKASLLNNAEMLVKRKDYDPYSEESIKEFLDKFGK